MFQLIAQNKYGEKFEITNNEAYVVTAVDGISPPDSTINTSKVAGADGSEYNSSSVNNRKITITLSINSPAEENRIALYNYFKAKEAVRLYIKNGSRDVYTDGYVQSYPIGYFEKKQVAQIVIVCPNPFLLADEDMIAEFSTVTRLFEFPFSIEEPIPFSEFDAFIERNIINAGDVETGAVIELHSKGEVVDPVVYLTSTGDFFGVNIEMKEGDSIIIDTRQKKKRVSLVRNGETTNIIGKVMKGSSWLIFRTGSNLLATKCKQSPEKLVATCDMQALYQGA